MFFFCILTKDTELFVNLIKNFHIRIYFYKLRTLKYFLSFKYVFPINQCLQHQRKVVNMSREVPVNNPPPPNCIAQKVKYTTKVIVWSVMSADDTGHLYNVERMMKKYQNKKCINKDLFSN